MFRATNMPVLIYHSLTTNKHNLELSRLSTASFFTLYIQTQIEIQKALKDDPTVYEYDAVYDEMEEKKKAVNVKVPEKDRKVLYIHVQLLQQVKEIANFLHEMCLLGINVAEFIKANIQFKIVNTTTLIQEFH